MLGDITKTAQIGNKVIEEYATRRVFQAIGVKGRTLAISVKVLNLSVKQERLVIDLLKLQRGMVRFGGDVNSLGGLASYLRNNQEARKWYQSQ